MCVFLLPKAISSVKIASLAVFRLNFSALPVLKKDAKANE